MDWANANKFLCIRLDNLGDVLMTTPAIRAIRESRPGCRITLLASPAGTKAAGLVPEIDETIVFEAPWIKASTPPVDGRSDLQLIDRLRLESFDAAVIFTVFTQNPLPAAYLAFLAGIPLRLAHCREKPYHLLTDWAAETDLDASKGVRHEVRRQLDLVAAVGYQARDERLSLSLPASLAAAVRKRLCAFGLDLGQPWVLIHPGASAPSRRYPPESYARAADLLAIDHSLQIVLTGGAGEGTLVREIQDRMAAAAINTAGSFNFEEFACLVSLAPLMICNNSGPAHLAAAAGAPVVDLYALTNPQHTPWMTPNRVLFHDVACKNCFSSTCLQGHHHCLRLVTPQEVVDAAVDLLAETQENKFE